MAARLQADLDERGIQIAHLKVTLSPGEEGGLAVLNQVRNEQPAELSRELIGLLAGADLLINLRAEGDPALLLAALHGALGEAAAAAGHSFSRAAGRTLPPGPADADPSLSPA